MVSQQQALNGGTIFPAHLTGFQKSEDNLHVSDLRAHEINRHDYEEPTCKC